MRKLQTHTNVNPPTTDYPYGRSRDNNGTGNGTPLNEATLGDYQQFFEKMFAESGIIANGLPDNAYTGWQLFDALRKACLPYRTYRTTLTQLGTAAPTATILQDEMTGIVPTRVSTGWYQFTKIGAFVLGKTFVSMPNVELGICTIDFSSDIVNVRTYNLSMVLSDGILSNSSMEILIYK